jgi:hypothetical protein
MRMILSAPKGNGKIVALDGNYDAIETPVYHCMSRESSNKKYLSQSRGARELRAEPMDPDATVEVAVNRRVPLHES